MVSELSPSLRRVRRRPAVAVDGDALPEDAAAHLAREALLDRDLELAEADVAGLERKGTQEEGKG